MEIEFDPDKEATNLAKHRISLGRASEMDALITEVDDRFDYGEVRLRTWGFIDGLPYCLAYTFRDQRVRAISLRRVHKKELRRYVR